MNCCTIAMIAVATPIGLINSFLVYNAYKIGFSHGKDSLGTQRVLHRYPTNTKNNCETCGFRSVCDGVHCKYCIECAAKPDPPQGA